MKRLGHALLLAAILSLAAQLPAQVTPGTPPLGSFGGGPFDILNLGSLNAHFSISIMNRPGRVTPFTYNITYDTAVWYPATVGSQKTWQPVTNWGWSFVTPNYSQAPDGYVTYQLMSSWTQPCNPPYNYNPVYVEVYGRWAYVDAKGTSHPFDISTSNYTGGCPAVNAPPYSASGVANDDSGYTINATANSATVYSASGTLINTAPSGSYSVLVTDANGNQITQSTGTTQVFRDTLGGYPLTVSGTNPVLFTYSGPNGTSPEYKVNYSAAQTIETHFGCSGVSEYTKTGVSLISSIVLPDNTSYAFTYETNSDGSTTGRLKQVTLPTGGTISYTYTGANGGINCTDGSIIGLNRNVSGNTWTYTRSPINDNTNHWQTTVTSPAGDVTIIDFQQDANTTYGASHDFYETQRKIYQGSSSLLLTTVQCYNGASTGYSNCPATKVTTPINQIDAYSEWPTGKTSAIETWLNGYGLPTEVKEYDYGVVLGSAPSSTYLRRDTQTGYVNVLNSNVVDKPDSIVIKDGNGNVVAQTNFTYDEYSLQASTATPSHVSVSGFRGNLTTISRLVGGSSWLTQHSHYYDTGMLYQSYDVNGALTTYNYPDAGSTCGNAFPTSVTMPILGQTPTQTFDCNGAVPTQTVDLNGNSTNVTYDLMWRPATISYPDGGQDSYVYGTSPTSVTKTSKISTSSNLVAETIYDGLGRVSTNEITSDTAGTDYVVTSYDSFGRIASATNPYRSTSDPTYGLTQYSYDALGRVLTVTHPDNSAIQTQYTGAATKVINEAGRTRISQSDGLGRLASVCEVTSATQMGNGGSPSACGQDIAGTGFLTTYGYNVLGNLTAVTQGSETRSYGYDEISRLTSETNPESGNTTYAYDSCSAGDLCSWTGPKPNQTGSTTITESYTYDALHRVTNRSYNDGVTPSVMLQYDQAHPWSAQLQNTKGRLDLVETTQSGTVITGSTFSYDKMGRTAAEWQCTPYNCGTGSFSLTFGYDLLGDKISLYNGEEGVTYSYSYDAAARLSGMQSTFNDANHPGTLFSVSQYNPLNEVQQATFGNGIARSAIYDNRGRLTSLTDGSIYSFTLGYTADNNIASGNDSVNGSWSYTYDDLARVATSSKTGQSFNYQYDRYGNRWQQNAPQGGPAPQYSFDTSNRITGSGVTYDAAGNVLNDGYHSYTYDAESRLISVDSGSTASYVYDASGQRVRSTVSGSTSDYLFDDQGRVITQLNGGTWNRSELYAGGMHVATYSDGTTYFDHSDWLGTVRARSYPNGSGAVTCTNVAFGDASTCTGPYASPVHFAGEEHDNESNLDHFLFRQYSSTQGRWTTPDPAGMAVVDPGNPQSWNRYAYVTNNPLGLIDPAGLCGVTTIFYQLSHDDQGKPNGIIFLGSNFVETYPGPCFAPCRYDPSATANGGLLCGMTLYMPTYSSNGPAANTGGIDLGALHGFPISIVSLNAVRNSMQCADKTIQNNKVALGQDALGFIPGEGLVHSLFGIAMGAVSSVTAAMNGDKAGAMLGVAGMHVSALEGVSKVVPVAGQLINVVATGHDVNRTGSDFNSCMSGNGGG